ncbi:MAG: ABC transporter ATP-binding protein [Fervidobacterium nodosum]
MSNMLSVKNLTKIYRIGSIFSRQKLIAVDNISFDIGEAEIFTLAGESGCGKTTTAKIILGLETTSSGEIYYYDRRIDNLEGNSRKEIYKEIQAVFQNPFTTFNPLRKIDSYFYDTLKNFMKCSPSEMERIIKEKLSAVGISFNEFSQKYPGEFSGGQLQRISIARSLLTDPKLLIADEPVSMVDASLRMSIVNLFKKLKEDMKISILYITHDLTTAYYVSDNIAIMFRGNIIEMGSASEVLTNPRHPYTKLLRESVPEPDPKKKWSVRVKLSDLENVEYSSKGCKFAGRCPYVMGICRNEQPPIKDVNGVKVKCFLYD